MTTPLIRYKKVQFKNLNRELILDQDFIQYLNDNNMFVSAYANPNRHPDVFSKSNTKKNIKQKYVGKLYNVLAQYYGKEFVGWYTTNIDDFRMRNIALQ